MTTGNVATVVRLVSVALATVVSVAARALDVRVDHHGGVPQIHVDGQPVRARMFFGRPDVSHSPIGPEGRLIEFTFRATEDEPQKATMHFRFGNGPGEIVLDDVRVVEVDTGRETLPAVDFEDGLTRFDQDWCTWPPDMQNTVGRWEATHGAGRNGTTGLRIALTEPPDGKWPDFHVYHQPNLCIRRGRQYRVSVWARSTVRRGLRIGFYRPGKVFVPLGAMPGCFDDQIRMAASAGIDFVSFPVGRIWTGPGTTPDYSRVDALCQRVLDANPKALLLPRISMEPPNWWKKAHPDHVMVWEDGPRERGFAVASEQYRQDASAQLTALVRHLEATFGDHVAGYHPSGHNTGEWFYQDTWQHKYHGYSKVTTLAWREWLRRTYGTDAVLQAAWGRADAAIATSDPPSPEARHAHPHGAFRDPASERAIIDFNLFQQEAMADCVRALAKAVREASDGRKLVVFFYGYVFEFGAVANGPAMSGHYALRRVLESPDIDILCSPISYDDRGLAESAPCMTAAESVSLAGKLWLNEDDTATFLSSGTFPGHRERVDTFEGSAAQMARNTAQEACRNFGTWWMDLGGTGWFRDERFWQLMRDLERIDLPLLAGPVPFRPPVAVVLDERSVMFVAERGNSVTTPLLRECRGVLARTGVPYGQYLLDDVTAGRVQADVYAFLCPWSLTEAQRQAVLRATRGKVRLWCYAPGLFDGFVRSPQTMRELTGFSCLELVAGAEARAEPTERGRAAGLTQTISVPAPIRPLFTVDAAPNETLATYPSGEPAIAVRRNDSGVDVFCGVPALSPELVRLAAREAGLRLLTGDDCVVYANGPFVTLHATQDGPVHLDLGPRTGPVEEVLTRRVIGTAPHLTLHLKRGETLILGVPRDMAPE